MKIRFVRSWRRFKPGDVFETQLDGWANVLVRRNIAEVVRPEPKRGRPSRRGVEVTA